MEPNPKNNGMATASMILGIISIVCFCLSFTYVTPPIGLVVGVIGLVLSITARKADSTNTYATVGLVLSIIGLVLCFITTLTCTVCTGCAACAFSRAAWGY